MEALSKKGTPASARTGTGAGTARLAPPCTATESSLHLSAPYQCQLIRGQPFMADYRPAAAGRGVPATPRRHSVSCGTPLIVCAVPGADQEGGSRARSLYLDSSCPATRCRAARRVSGTVRAHGRPDARFARAFPARIRLPSSRPEQRFRRGHHIHHAQLRGAGADTGQCPAASYHKRRDSPLWFRRWWSP